MRRREVGTTHRRNLRSSTLLDREFGGSDTFYKGKSSNRIPDICLASWEAGHYPVAGQCREPRCRAFLPASPTLFYSLERSETQLSSEGSVFNAFHTIPRQNDGRIPQDRANAYLTCRPIKRASSPTRLPRRTPIGSLPVAPAHSPNICALIYD